MISKFLNLKTKQLQLLKPLLLSIIFSSALFLPPSLKLIKFALLILALIFASNSLGIATEELSAYFSSTLSGLINATFGNLAEIIIGFFVILQGHTELAKASITGSILSNLVLLVGLAFLVASYKKESIRLQNKVADTSSTLLLTSVLFLLFPSLLFLFHEQEFIKPISISIAIILLSIYFFYIIFSFFTHKKWFVDKNKKHVPVLSKGASLILMLISIVILTILSEYIANVIEPIGQILHLNQLFLGAIIIGFVGNAAEHLSVITLAKKQKHEFILPIAIGSSIQVAMFVGPLLVLLSIFTRNFMSLVFSPLEIFSIFVAVLLANQIASDKEITWFESVQLIGLYLIIAITFYFVK